jgi:xylose isomerase
VAYWHTFGATGADPFGKPTMMRPWDDGTETVDNYLRKMQVAFSFFQKLGVRYYCFHDRDIAPEGKSLAETNRNLDKVVKLAKTLQQDTGIRLLWGTANLFSHPRYMNGAATNPDVHVFAYAAAQVKKAMEVTHFLDGDNYVFWGGREGYASLLNTQMKREQDHLAHFLELAKDYKHALGFKGTLLIEPKPKEPTTHQYDFDAAAVLSFLRNYGLKQFKLNIECNHASLAGHTFAHELQTASDAGLLGSIDANTGDPIIGWDTDQFNLDLRVTVAAMLIVLSQGGIAPGGFNFDAKLRRESIDIKDMFIAHISSIDAFSRSLLIANEIITDGTLEEWQRNRYESFDHGIGAKVETKLVNFKDLEHWVLNAGEPTPKSGRQEQYESLLASFW